MLTTVRRGVRTIGDMTATVASARAPRRIDVAVVLAVIALVVIGTSQIDADPGTRAVDALAIGCGVIGAASLAWWRRWSVGVTAVVTLAISVYLARDYPGGPALMPGPLALLALGYTSSRRRAWIGAAGLAVTTTISRLVADRAPWPHVLVLFGWAAAAVLAGQALGGRGERSAAERERVAHAHEQALTNERLRIAQDLHDSVAHAMATINVQSGVAAHLIDRQPEQAAKALEAIRAASADALDELGTILGVLREPDSHAPVEPMAGLADIVDLVERARTDGLRVALTTDGDSSGVPPTLAAAAFRVAQEALTNSRRHAGPRAKVDVAVDVGDRGELRVRVTDDGGVEGTAPRADVASSGGFGLVGMRERVESSGGTLDVGPTAGGFRVLARWPPRP